MASRTQQWELEEYHDPSLQYINHLLMEEDIDDRKCTLYEPTALQATLKSFSDILNHRNERIIKHSRFSYDEDCMFFEEKQKNTQRLRPAEDHAFARDMRLDGTKLIPSEFPLHQGKVSLHSLYFGCQTTLDVGWLHPERHFSSEPDHGYVDSESFGFDMLQTTNDSTKHDCFNENLNIDVYSDTTQAQLTKRRYPFNSSTENSLLSSANQESTSYNSRLKGSVGSMQPGAKGNSHLSSDDHDYDGIHTGDVESLTFVGNEDLKAELYAKVVNEDLTSLIEKLRNSRLKPSLDPRTGNPKTAELATTADLKNMLHSCAQAVADGYIPRANEILKEIRQESSPYGNDMQRIAHYFAEGLFARITGTGAAVYKALCNSLSPTSKILKAHRMLVDASPFPKLSHVFTSRAFVEAAKDASSLHIIDYGIWYGIQWPGVISALAERKGGPPYIRMTIIEFPESVDNPANIAEWTGQKLSEYARAYGVPFEYHVIVDKWENITASTVGLREEEVVVVHSTFRLRHVLDESVTSSNPRTTVLKNILEMNPKLFFHGAINRGSTSPFFLPRFREALSSFSTFFNLLETVAPSNSQERLLFEREFAGREILNIIACEGEERVERPETYKQWQSRIYRVGFVQIPLDGDMVKHFQDFARTHYNKNFTVDMDENWLLFGWKGKVNGAFTLWRPRLAL